MSGALFESYEIISEMEPIFFGLLWMDDNRNYSDFTYVKIIGRNLEGNQNKKNCLLSNLYDKLKSPALFSHLFRTEKRARNFNLL